VRDKLVFITARGVWCDNAVIALVLQRSPLNHPCAQVCKRWRAGVCRLQSGDGMGPRHIRRGRAPLLTST
jgi:hypothetical protein